MAKLKTKMVNFLPLNSYLYLRKFAFKTFRSKDYELFRNLKEIVTEDSYSYKSFTDTKSIFLHIPKCAGVSINKALYGNLAGGHTTLSNYIYVFTPAELNNFFKFTVVRNPWDRLVSAYFFLAKGGMNERDRAWALQNIDHIPNFEIFVKEWLTKENVQKYLHFRPQSNYFLDIHKGLKIDYFAFLENLNNDFVYLSNKVGVKTKLSDRNKTEHDDYRKYYDDAMVDIVSDVYADDIKLLGYNFHNENLRGLIERRDRQHNYPYESI